MITEQEIYNLNLDFAILRELMAENGLEKSKCSYHAIRWYLKMSDIASKNMIYVLSQHSTADGSRK